MIKTTTKQIIHVGDFDNLVESTYGRPYNFQQQDGCKERQNVNITVPCVSHCMDYENDTIPEEVNGDEMGVSFAAWLARDPEQPLPDREDEYGLSLFWERNFYPDVQMVLNDLHAKGLFPAGEYVIEIDW